MLMTLLLLQAVAWVVAVVVQGVPLVGVSLHKAHWGPQKQPALKNRWGMKYNPQYCPLALHCY